MTQTVPGSHLPPRAKNREEESALQFSLRVLNKMQQTMSSAKKRNLEYGLTYRDVEKLMKRKRCAYTGVAMTDFTMSDDSDPNHRTFERVDNALGYIPGNVIAITSLSNGLKNELFERVHTEGFGWKNNITVALMQKLLNGLVKADYKQIDRTGGTNEKTS